MKQHTTGHFANLSSLNYFVCVKTYFVFILNELVLSINNFSSENHCYLKTKKIYFCFTVLGLYLLNENKQYRNKVMPC